MDYIYKTKSVQERMDLMGILCDRHPRDGGYSSLLYGIETEYDWISYPYIVFSSEKSWVSLVGDCVYNSTYHEINTAEEFLRVCDTNISYGGLTIPKHRFI